MIKTFKIDYGLDASVTVEVDEEKVAAYEWQGKKRCIWTDINEFWSGHENRLADAGGDVRLAALKLLGENAIHAQAAERLNLQGLIYWFDRAEGWPPVDGSFGIEIVAAEAFTFEEDWFEVNEVANAPT